MIRVALADVDSKIPNLALMRLSTYWKARGAEVRLYKHRPDGGKLRSGLPLDLIGWADHAYVSAVFTWNRDAALSVGRQLSCPDVQFGGTGIGFNRLPPEIEACPPDYSIYGTRIAVGFCNRGCLRKCQFCVVPQLEGPIRQDRYSPPWDWVPDGFSKALLLDNEMADYPYDQQREIYAWFRDTGRKWCQTQGYDLRIVARDDRLAPLIADYKPWDIAFKDRRLYTAWDYIGNEAPVRIGIERLLAAGFKPRQITTYILVGFNTTHDQDLHRFNVLHGEYGVDPYAMPFNNRKDDPWLRRFVRYCNRHVYRACSWEDYDRLAHERRTRGRVERNTDEPGPVATAQAKETP
jgi:hypothetical protein